MTNSEPFDQINARLDDFAAQLEQLGEETDLLRTIQNANRRELRFNSQSLTRLERIVSDLSKVVQAIVQQAAEDRQQAALDRNEFRRFMEDSKQQAALDRQQAAIDRKTFQDAIEASNQRAENDRAEIRRIWEHLSKNSQ